MRSLQNRVVVITGASSGIGRATAVAFAKEGARIVISARRKDRLDRVAEDCMDLNAECLPVPCDVSDEKQVRDLAELAVRRFGRIDVWINNAAVTAYGQSHELPEDVARMVIETNLLGTIYGSRSALAQFKSQGQGILINVSSLAGKIGHPYMSAYSASKYGIVGLSDAIRGEVRHDPDIHVCTVLPVATDTPLFQHGANYLGREAQPPTRVYSPHRVARTIVSLARHPRREVCIGSVGNLFCVLQRLAPAIAERSMASLIERKHFRRKATGPHAGNLGESTRDPYAVTGGWQNRASAERSGRTPWLGIGLASLGAVVLYWLLRPEPAPRSEAAGGWEDQMRGLSEVAHVPEGASEHPELVGSFPVHLDRAR